MTEDAVYKDYLDFPLYEGSPDEVSFSDAT